MDDIALLMIILVYPLRTSGGGSAWLISRMMHVSAFLPVLLVSVHLVKAIGLISRVMHVSAFLPVVSVHLVRELTNLLNDQHYERLAEPPPHRAALLIPTEGIDFFVTRSIIYCAM